MKWINNEISSRGEFSWWVSGPSNIKNMVNICWRFKWSINFFINTGMLSLPNTFPFSLYLSLVSPGGRGKSLLKTSSCSVLINKKQFSHRLTGWSVWSTLIGRGISRLGSHWSRASPVLLAPAVLCHKEAIPRNSPRHRGGPLWSILSYLPQKLSDNGGFSHARPPSQDNFVFSNVIRGARSV